MKIGNIVGKIFLSIACIIALAPYTLMIICCFSTSASNTAELIGGQHNGYIYEIKIKPRVMLRLSVLHNSLIEAEM